MADIQNIISDLEKKEAELKTAEDSLQSVQQKTAEEQQKLEALGKERERVLTELKSAREEKEKALVNDKSFQEKFREEQKTKATERFFTEFGYTDEAKKKELLTTFARIDAGTVDAENIYKDLVRSHLHLNPDHYIEIERKAKQFAGSADDFIKAQSASAFAGAGDGVRMENVEITEEDIAAANFAGISLEVYRDLKKRGKV